MSNPIESEGFDLGQCYSCGGDLDEGFEARDIDGQEEYICCECLRAEEDDEFTCGCRPCPKCEGEKQIPLRISEGSDGRGPDCRVVLEYQDCPMCKGTGRDNESCEVPAHSEEVTA